MAQCYSYPSLLLLLLYEWLAVLTLGLDLSKNYLVRRLPFKCHSPTQNEFRLSEILGTCLLQF